MKRDQSTFWLATWRIGGVVAIAAVVGLFAHQSVAASSAGVAPVELLECAGEHISMAEPVHLPDLPRDRAAAFGTPDALAEHWVAQWNKRAVRSLHVESTLTDSADTAHYALEDDRGRLQAVLLLAMLPELGWVVQSHYECA